MDLQHETLCFRYMIKSQYRLIKHKHLFIHPCLCLLQQPFLPYYIIYPISDFLLYPSHTHLLLSYSAISCEGCEVYRSFLLKEKKFKATSVELLRHFVTLCASQTRLWLRQRRSSRSTSFLRLMLTRTRPIQLIMEN